MLDIFHTLAQVAVAVTGFSSLIIIFRGDSALWNRLDYVHLGSVLTWSIISIFLALLPVLLAEFGMDIQQAARIGLFTALALIVVIGGVITRAQRMVLDQTNETPPGKIQLIMASFVAVIFLVTLMAASELLPGPLNAWLALTIIALLGVSIADLGFFVIHSAKPNDE
ncbi:MAG: hypothetical protein AAF512_05885 [Pseudomonadota bacterium]